MNKQKVEINDVCFSTTESKVIAGTNRGSIEVWDVKT
jgi:hypothetical protein